MKIKKFECILDDGQNVWKEYIPATSKKELLKNWGGNGEFVKIKEVPACLPSAEVVRSTLVDNGFEQAECDLVYRILCMYVEGTSGE